MKKLLLSVVTTLISIATFAQAPQSFQYQAVVRDVNGVALQNQSVGFQLSIISGLPTGTVEYIETHSATTNGYGIVTLAVGSGTVVSGTFSSIGWGTSTYYLKVEADLGSGYVNMGTTQLLSVPYSLNSAKSDNATNADHATNSDYATVAGNVQTYTAGSGISIVGNVVTNTQPDQTVTLTGSGATSITGTYPNFTISSTDNNTTYTGGTGINVTGTTISNTQPDQTVTLTGSGATSVTGTYPNFTISSTDNNTTYSAGTGLNLTGTTFSSTQTLAQTLSNGNSAGTNNILMNNNNITGAHILGLGSSNSNYIDMYFGHIYDYNGSHGANGQVLTVHGTSPNTYVTWDTPQSYVFGNGLSLTGNTVNSVWSVNGNHIYNNNTGNVGVGINNPTGKMVVQGDIATPDTIPLFEVKDKLGHTVFVVYPDSVHIYVKDTGVKSNKGGFAVSGKNTVKAITHDFLYVDPDYTRVFTGDTIAGFGVKNIGTTDNSYMQLNPNNYFIGHNAGVSNVNGMYNLFLGYEAGKASFSGDRNVLIGYRSGSNSSLNSFNDNIFIGDSTGINNNSFSNIFIGNYAGQNNNAYNNICIGVNSGRYGTTGQYNTYLGTNSGLNSSGSLNTFIGNGCGNYNTSGQYNVFVGCDAGYGNTIGSYNTFIGEYAHSSGNFNNSVSLGYGSTVPSSNTVLLGNASTLAIGGAVGYNVISDKRVKLNIKENVPGLAFINKLKPVTYNLNVNKLAEYLNEDYKIDEKGNKVKVEAPDFIKNARIEKSKILYTGFLAQDVEQAANEVGYDFSGINKPTDENGFYSLKYAEFTVPIVKAIQELNQKVEDQQKIIEKLELEIQNLKK